MVDGVGQSELRASTPPFLGQEHPLLHAAASRRHVLFLARSTGAGKSFATASSRPSSAFTRLTQDNDRAPSQCPLLDMRAYLRIINGCATGVSEVRERPSMIAKTLQETNLAAGPALSARDAKASGGELCRATVRPARDFPGQS